MGATEVTPVLSISGISGGGKSTLVQAVRDHLPGAGVVRFDGFSFDQRPEAPAAAVTVADPIRAFNQYDLTDLAAAIQAAQQNHAIVIVDYPFGRVNRQIAPRIDLAFDVQTPLDVAFARALRRDYAAADTTKADILAWAKAYLTQARPLFVVHDTVVSQHVDQVIDGMRPLAEKVKTVVDALRAQQLI